jgi:8-oxo-dGTP pyrophosphatase MutT (NUDIX family)
MIEQIRPELKYANKFVEVFDDVVRFPDGSTGTYLRVVHPHHNGRAVVVLPVCDSKIGLVKSYRYPIMEWQWALPRGFGHGLDVMQSARAELREELGVAAESWEHLGTVTPDSGMLGTKVDVLLAYVAPTALAPEDTKEIEAAEWFEAADVVEMIKAGEIEDGFTLSAVAMASLRGLFPEAKRTH